MSSINVKPQGTPNVEALGAGAVYVGGDITDWGTTPGVLLGVTKGGNSFNDNAEFRTRSADADYFAVKGARDLVAFNPQLTTNQLACSTTDLAKCFAGAVKTTGTTYDTVNRTIDLSTSYIDTLWWIGQTRSGLDVAIRLDNALGDGPITFSTTKDEEIVLNVIFTAHADPATFDPTDETTYPYAILIEK